jgi:flagella basal body P-ring formation protein FlgA
MGREMRGFRLILGAVLTVAVPAPAYAQSAGLPVAERPMLPAPVPVPVLARAVAKGDLIGEGDFVTQDMPAAAARGAPRVKDVAGMEAQRALMAGAIVRLSDVIRPQLVRRGEPVTIALREGGLSITTQGRALSNGASGDFVRVVSLSTNHTLDGVVEGSGAVRVSAH